MQEGGAPRSQKIAVSVSTLDGQDLRVSRHLSHVSNDCGRCAKVIFPAKFRVRRGLSLPAKSVATTIIPTVAVVAALICRLRAAKVQEARALWSGHAAPASNST